MKKTTAEMITTSADMLGIDVEVSSDYSGRGMYGATTYSVTLPSLTDLPAICAHAVAIQMREADDPQSGWDDVKEFIADLRNLRTDNMGRRYVAY